MTRNNNGTRVAILCATRDGERWIAQQVESMLCQSGLQIDIFFSDDQSSDGTVRWLKERATHDDRVHFLNHAGSFGSGAMNFFRLLREVNFQSFDYIALADQDDIWITDKLAHAISSMDRESSDGYSSDLMAFDDAKKKSWYLKKTGTQRDLDYLFQGASAGCTYVLSKKAALLVQGTMITNQKYCHIGLSHDWLIYAICRSHGLSWFQDETTRILYRQHSSNAYGALPGIIGLIQKAKSVRSGWYRTHTLELRQFLGESSTEELSVFSAIERYKLNDKIWLFINAHRFRRNRRDVFLLRFSFLFGLF